MEDLFFSARCRLFSFHLFQLFTLRPLYGGERKEKIDRSAVIRFQPAYDKPSESHTFLSPQSEGDGYNHFKAIYIIAYPVALSYVAHGIAFQQLHILVDCTDYSTDIATEYTERIGHFLLRHPYGSGRNSDHPVFVDCDYSTFHNYSPISLLKSVSFGNSCLLYHLPVPYIILTAIRLSMSFEIFLSVTSAYRWVVFIPE